MKNYKVHFNEEERDAVIGLITKSNDIVLNQVEPESVFITIQLEDDEADVLYANLQTQIDREVRIGRTAAPSDDRPGPDFPTV